MLSNYTKPCYVTRKRGTQCKNVLFNVKACVLVEKHFMKTEKRRENVDQLSKMLSNTKTCWIKCFSRLIKYFLRWITHLLPWITRFMRQIILLCVGLIKSKNMLSNGNIFYPTWTCVVHCKCVLSNVDKCNPTHKPVFRHDPEIHNENVLSNATNVLSNVITHYTMQERVLQCKNILSNAKTCLSM